MPQNHIYWRLFENTYGIESIELSMLYKDSLTTFTLNRVYLFNMCKL